MDAGVYGINMPVEWGGAGLTLLEQVIVEEEFGKVTNCLWDIPWRPSNVLAHGIARAARAYLLPILRGERFDAFATTEPESGSDAGAIRTTATPVEGGWVINGEKWFVTCGDVADFLLVQANVRPGQRVDALLRRQGTPGRADQPDAAVHALRGQRPPRVRVRGRLRARRTRCSARSGRASS